MPAISVNGKVVRFAIEDGTLSFGSPENKIGYDILGEQDGRVLVKVGDSIREIFCWVSGGDVVIHSSGITISFSVLTDRDLLLQSFESEKGAHHRHSEIRAPMPGLVVDVLVRKGDNIKHGATMVVLEAMKMENEIRAPQDARVTNVLVKAGDVVEKDQTILTLE